MTAIVVGASSGLGRALAEELARRGQALLLVASDASDLEALAADLKLRHAVAVQWLALDLAREPDPGRRIAQALDQATPLDALLLVAGFSRDDDDFSLAAGTIGELVAINLHAPLAITHTLLPLLLATGGTLVLAGSIAATRGRGRNVVYAAAKRGLVSLYESLRQRYRERELRVQLYQLGFLASNLSYGRRLPLPALDTRRAAYVIARNLRKRSGCRFLPRRFGLVALVLRALPLPLFRRLRD